MLLATLTRASCGNSLRKGFCACRIDAIAIVQHKGQAGFTSKFASSVWCSHSRRALVPPLAPTSFAEAKRWQSNERDDHSNVLRAVEPWKWWGAAVGGALGIGCLALWRFFRESWGANAKEVNAALRRVDQLHEQGLLKEALAELENVKDAKVVVFRRGKITVELLDKGAYEETHKLKETVTEAIMDHPSVISIATVAKDMSKPRPWSYVVEVGVEHDTPEVRSALSTEIRMSGVKDEYVRSKVQFVHTGRVSAL